MATFFPAVLVSSYLEPRMTDSYSRNPVSQNANPVDVFWTLVFEGNRWQKGHSCQMAMAFLGGFIGFVQKGQW